MVNKEALGEIHNLPVHRNNGRPFGKVIVETSGIERCAISLGKPIEVIEPVEILRVNKGEFAFGEADFAVGVAEFAFAIEKHRPGENTVKPIRNTDC